MVQHRGLKIGFIGFVIAFVGAAVGFSGFHIDERWLSLAGFIITVFGVVIGFVGIAYGWITEGKQAIGGSVEAAGELRSKLKRLWK